MIYSEKETVCKIPVLLRLKMSTNNMILACAGCIDNSLMAAGNIYSSILVCSAALRNSCRNIYALFSCESCVGL